MNLRFARAVWGLGFCSVVVAVPKPPFSVVLPQQARGGETGGPGCGVARRGAACEESGRRVGRRRVGAFPAADGGCGDLGLLPVAEAVSFAPALVRVKQTMQCSTRRGRWRCAGVGAGQELGEGEEEVQGWGCCQCLHACLLGRAEERAEQIALQRPPQLPAQASGGCPPAPTLDLLPLCASPHASSVRS